MLQFYLTLISLEPINLDHIRKLKEVQLFYSNVQYTEDYVNWGEKDYWASPLETLEKMKGDCEDIAIAKYFSLIYKGVPIENLRLSYIKHLNKIHIVLEYVDNNVFIILDNRFEAIYFSNDDYLATRIASFNHHNLWVNETVIGKSRRMMRKWDELLSRLDIFHNHKAIELEQSLSHELYY
ncbi:hypothetical protein BWP24_27620 (plasmid) [Vibrio campbellii]|uniref:transglutaminase-like cysteine peptidase n=1 Tax=Vibrio campbellii TaxID=680 RepID=UPI0009718C0C|nr:transglutaminase-like cysteine peptidase [Vibrio campbellii]APX09967.1 hypothetical protein BWP24_27620 [Vibrio campbellii]